MFSWLKKQLIFPNSDFKSILDCLSIKEASINDPYCRLRMISLADERIYSINDFKNAKKNAKSWKTQTVIALPSGKILVGFLKKILNRIKNPVILLIVDFPYSGLDYSSCNIFSFLSDDRISHVFAENWFDQPHHKLTIIPIGLENPLPDGKLLGETSEVDFLNIVNQAIEPKHKPTKVLCNAHLLVNHKPASGSYDQRSEVMKILGDKSFCDFWRQRRSRHVTWHLHSNYAFELCPEGNGLDTHRFYEAIWLKTIPIVKRNTLAPLYEKFPCLIVDHWEDVTEALLSNSVTKYIHDTNMLRMGIYKEMILEQVLELV